MPDMGVFRTTVIIENLAERGRTRALPDMLVDTASEYTWAPADALAAIGIAPN